MLALRRGRFSLLCIMGFARTSDMSNKIAHAFLCPYAKGLISQREKVPEHYQRINLKNKQNFNGNEKSSNRAYVFSVSGNY